MSKNLRLKTLLGMFALLLAFGWQGIMAQEPTLPPDEPNILTFEIDGQVPASTTIDTDLKVVSIVMPCNGIAALEAATDGTVTHFTIESFLGAYGLFWGNVDNSPDNMQYLMTTSWYTTIGLVPTEVNMGTPLFYGGANDLNPDPMVIEVELTLKSLFLGSALVLDGQDEGDIASTPWTVSITEEVCDTDNSLTGFWIQKPNCLGEWVAVPRERVDNNYTIELLESDAGNEMRMGFTIAETATSVPMPSPPPIPVSFELLDPPLVIVVTAQDGTPATYTVTPNWTPASDVKELTAFKFTLMGFDYIGTITDFDVVVEVPHDTDVTALAGIFELDDAMAVMTHSEDPAVLQESGVTENDYTTPVAFTVHAQDCSTVEYWVTVTFAEECCNDILEPLSVTGWSNPCDDNRSAGIEFGCDDIPEDIEFVLDVDTKTFTAEVPFGMNLGSVTLVGMLSPGATSVPALGDITSFTPGVPVLVTVTAENLIDTEVWTLIVNKGDAHTGTELISFEFLAADNPALDADVTGEFFSNAGANRVDLYVPYGTDVSALVATFTSSDYSCVYVNGPLVTDNTKQCSGDTPNDWTGGQITYMVRSEAGVYDVGGGDPLKSGVDPSIEEYYSVWVIEGEPSDDARLLDLDITGDLMNCVDLPMDVDFEQVDNHNWTINLSNTLADASFEVTFVIPGLDAVATPASPLALTLADFQAGPVVISVQPQDPLADPTLYTITPNFYDPSDVKVLVSYSVELMGHVYTAEVNQTTKQVVFTVPFGTDDLTGMMLVGDYVLEDDKAILTHSEDPQEVQESGVSVNDFNDPVAFTVFAEDCSTVEYFVTITEAENCCNDILAIDMDAMGYDNCDEGGIPSWPVTNIPFIEGADNEWTAQVPYGVDLSTIVLDETLSPGATWVVTSGTWPGPVHVTVTAENEISTQDFTLMLNVASPSDAHMITRFDFLAEDNTALDVDVIGMIDEAANRIDLEVPYGTDVTMLIADFDHSAHSCVYINGPGVTDFFYQTSGMTANNFTGPLHYTVIAQDKIAEDYYNVYVTEGPADTQNDLTPVALTGLMNCLGDPATPVWTMDGNVINIRLRENMDESTYFTFDYTIPELAMSDMPMPLTGIMFVDGVGVDITVTAQSGDEAVYTLMPTYVSPSSNKQITYFAFDFANNPQWVSNYMGTINEAAKTISVNVPYGSVISDLVATFELHDEFAWMTHSEEINDLQVVQWSEMSHVDYTTPVAFTVYDEACRTVEYFVTVTILPNTGNNILSLTLDGEASDCYDTWDVEDLDFMPGADNYWTVTVPYGFNLNDFVLTGELSEGATMMPTMASITSYTDEIPVTVTAVDGLATQDFTLKVMVGPASTAHELLAFNFMMEENEGLTKDVMGMVDQSTHRVDLVVPYGTDVTSLVACFEVSPYACFYMNGPDITDYALQTDCVSANDFSDPLHFTVRAQDGVTEDNYNVVVTFEDPDLGNTLSDLKIHGLMDCLGYAIEPDVTMANGVYTIRLREGMDEDTHFTVMFDIPELATAMPASGFSTMFEDGEAVEIVVTAQSGAKATYTLMPEYVTPSNKKQLTYFAFEPYADGMGNMQFIQTYIGTIDEAAKTVTVHVPYSSTVTNLVATFELDDKYARMTHSEEMSDLRVPQTSGLSAITYHTPAAFTVYDEACNTVEYFVTVIVDPNEGNEILSLMLDGMQYANCECGDEDVVAGVAAFEGMDITMTVPYGTDLSDFELDVVLAPGATSVPDLSTVTSYEGPVTIVVTADDGLATKTYTLTMVMADPEEGNQLMTFGFTDEFNEGLEGGEVWATIDETKKRVDVQVAYGTPVESLIASFTHSPYSCVFINGPGITDFTEQCSGVTVNDFSVDLTYTVIAQNGDEEYYNVFVEVLPPDTEQWLSDFMVHNLPECFEPLTYDVMGTMDGTAIDVQVKAGTDVTALEVTFEVPAKAMVSPAPGVHDFTNPVTFTVTAQDGTSTDYVVTVTEYALSSEKMIKSFSFPMLSSTGTINQTDRMIEVWVPWMTDISSLVAKFTLSDGAVMTHSEDGPVLQTSEVSANDYTTPVAFTVWAEDCSTLEYFVIVHITPNTNTGISQFVIPYTGCGCDLGVKVDDYAKRVYVRIPYADADGNMISLTSLTPTMIGIADGATISPAAGVAQDFSGGEVSYTVTAPDGVTKATWTVLVENPPCIGTDILSWHLVGDMQVGDAVIDTDDHSILAVVKPGTDISSLVFNYTLDCGATICCSAGNCAGQEIDFSGDDQCHTCTVTAQDGSIEQAWTICIRYQDVTPPDVWTNSVLVHNCDETVDVWASEKGTVYIIEESFVTSCTSMSNLDDIVDDHYGASADYPYADSIVSVSTNGLYSGKYYAFAVDSAGNVSCASEEAFYVDVCVKEVANLCDLRAASPVYMYVVTGEVLVSYEEGNMKFVQDNDCGIKIVDQYNGLPSVYGVGQGLTMLKGMIHDTGVELVFTPVCCYSPTKTTSGNTIVPKMLSYDEFKHDCYEGGAWESMLVRVVDPMIAFDDYSSANPLWAYDMLDLATTSAKGDYDWFIQKVFNANYIGDVIPTDPTIYQGIRTNVDWGSIYGLITPRSKDDIIKVTGGLLLADPNPAEINGVLPGQCAPVSIDVINQGVGNITISALYLDDSPGTDEFELIDPMVVPFTLDTWEHFTALVHFCPKDNGDESTTLLVEYGNGKVLEVPINGTTATINDMDWCDDFGTWTQGEWIGNGWTGTVPGNLSVYPSATQGWGGTPDASIALFLRNRWQVGGTRVPIEVVTPGVNVTGNDPVISWVEMAYSNFNGTGTNSSPRNLYISTDGVNFTLVDSYLTSSMPDPAVNAGDWFRPKQYSLKDYVGQTIWWKFELISNNNEYIYWILDNVCIQEAITEPILKHGPDPIDLGGVQVNESATQTITFTNVGVSVAKIKSVELISPDGYWTLTDNNTYPVEIHDGDWAYAKNGTDAMTVDVTFAPMDIGVSTATMVVKWGLYEEKTYTLSMSGNGLSCFTATEAFVGENWAASQNSWFTYTAEKFQIVNINSCHPNNTVDPYVYSYDTWLWVFADCAGDLTKDAANPNVIAQNDDLEWDACPYNRASSGVQFALYEGETVKIFWPWEFTSVGDDQGFYFNIEPSYPTDGDVCETAIPLTLPVVNHFGTTVGFEDDYDISPCSPFSNYMDGNDKVYSITLEYEGYLTGSILGAYGSIHVLSKCPVEELEKRDCKAFASGPNGGSFEKRIQEGTYYVIVSTWAPPQTVDYLMNLSFRGLGVESDELVNSMSVYPNPTDGRFTVSISNAEATDMTLELVNISGQVVYRNEVKSTYSYTEEIDASAFAKGVYYLKVNDGEEVKIEKIVIQ